MVDLDSLVPYSGNAKRHTNEQIDAVCESIKQLGFGAPLVCWHNDDGQPEIVAGHARAIAAQKLGIKRVPVVFRDDWTDAQRRAYTLADNQTTMMTGWDSDQLAYELDTLADSFDMEDFGFDMSGTEEEEQPGEVPFAEFLDEEHEYIVLKFERHEDFAAACDRFGVEQCDLLATGNRTRYGLGRVVDGAAALDA